MSASHAYTGAPSADAYRAQPMSALGKQLNDTFGGSGTAAARDYSRYRPQAASYAATTTAHHLSQPSPSHAGSLRGVSAWQAYSQPSVPARPAPYTPLRPAESISYQPATQYTSTLRQASPGRHTAAYADSIAAATTTQPRAYLTNTYARQPAAHTWAAPLQLPRRDSFLAQQGVTWQAPGTPLAQAPPPTAAATLQPGSILGPGAAAAAAAAAATVAAGVAAREDSRLKEMLQEVRHERRRLEDKILEGDSKGIRLQELRDELAKQVGALSRQKDTLEIETGGMATARDTALAAEQEVAFLQQAFAAEQQTAAQLEQIRTELEARVSELTTTLDQLNSQHTQTVAGLTSERDALTAKHARAISKLTKAEGDLAATRFELEAMKKELHARELSLTEVRASAEILQSASAQMQAQLTTDRRDAETRCTELTRQLEESQRDASHAHTTAQETRTALQEATAQLKESLARSDFLRQERDKVLKTLKEQQTVALEFKKRLDASLEQVSTLESSRTELEQTHQQQIEALQKEHDARIAAVTRQFEAQLVAAEKTASAAARHHDSSVQTGEKLLEVHAALRRERDQLWSELEGVRAELSATQQERDQLASKVDVLRAEVKSTMEDVRHDRDARLMSAAQHHDMELTQMRTQYERQIAAAARDHEMQVTELLSTVSHLKQELSDTQRTADKHRGTALLLRDQLAEALVLRDNLEREVIQERQYGEELGRLVAEMKYATRDLPN